MMGRVGYLTIRMQQAAGTLADIDQPNEGMRLLRHTSTQELNGMLMLAQRYIIAHHRCRGCLSIEAKLSMKTGEVAHRAKCPAKWSKRIAIEKRIPLNRNDVRFFELTNHSLEFYPVFSF